MTTQESVSAGTYRCPACGAALRFEPSEGKLHCDSCGQVYDVESIQMLAGSESEGSVFDWGAYREELLANRETLTGTVSYSCQACGAVMETAETTVALNCPYCGSTVNMTGRVGQGLRPNGVIPFKVTGKGLKDVVKNFMKGHSFLPTGFTDEARLEKLQGMYVPFWLFNAKLGGPVTLDAEKEVQYSDRTSETTEISHYLIKMNAGMRFENLAVDGSSRLSAAEMDSVGPYDYSEVVPFDEGYLQGFVADRFDLDPDELFPKAEKRMIATAEEVLRSEAGEDYTRVTVRSHQLKVEDPSVRYVLLPVYKMPYRYGKKDYPVYINGQTGKVIGEIPVDKTKKNLTFWGLTLGIAAVIFLIVFFLL